MTQEEASNNQDDPGLHCPHCGYKLTGIPANHRCPECGFGFQRAAIHNLALGYAAAKMEAYARLSL